MTDNVQAGAGGGAAEKINEIWSRTKNESLGVLYRVLFVVAFFCLAGWILLAAALLQTVAVLATGKANPNLAGFNRGLVAFLAQLVGYVTWVHDEKPFPFSDWPQE
jgi:hypothetical protein